MISDVGLAYQTVKIELEYMGVPQQLAIYLPSVIITLWVSLPFLHSWGIQQSFISYSKDVLAKRQDIYIPIDESP